MDSVRVFLDTNILLDVIDARLELVQESRAVLRPPASFDQRRHTRRRVKSR